MRDPQPGDRYLVDVCTTSDWRTARDVEVVVEKVTRLGCGCRRLETTRPGPADGQFAGRMDLFVQRCQFHQANAPAGDTVEPRRVS